MVSAMGSATLLGYPITDSEALIFWVYVIAMGLNDKRTVKSYFDDKDLLRVPFFGQHMSFNRFDFICRYSHFVDDSLPHEKDSSQPGYDPIWKIRDFFEAVRNFMN